MKTHVVESSLFLPGKFWSDWIEVAYGVLLAAAAYLFFCSGQSFIPWKIARYFLLLGSLGMFLSAFSVRENRKWSLKSLVLFALLLPAYVLFAVGPQIRFPGTEWIEKEAAALSLLFLIIPVVVHGIRRPGSSKIMLTSFCAATVVGVSAVRLLAVDQIEEAVSLTLARNGCVFLTRERAPQTLIPVSSADQINIGVVVSASSDRIYFVEGTTASMWSYAEMTRVYTYLDETLTAACVNKKRAANLPPL